MDAFEQIVKGLESKTGEAKEAELKSLKEECICPDCPTYNLCADRTGEILYCILGRSEECISEELGCNCPDCPVAARGGLTELYYCIKGSEMEMRAERKKG